MGSVVTLLFLPLPRRGGARTAGTPEIAEIYGLCPWNTWKRDAGRSAGTTRPGERVKRGILRDRRRKFSLPARRLRSTFYPESRPFRFPSRDQRLAPRNLRSAAKRLSTCALLQRRSNGICGYFSNVPGTRNLLQDPH